MNTDISLADVASTIARRWKLFACCCVLAGAAATVVAFKTVPVYRADAIVAAATEENTGAGLSALASQIAPIAGIDLGAVGGHSSENAWIATLNSNQMLRRFLDEQTSLQELFPGRWDPATKAWKRGLLGRSQEPTQNDGILLIKRKLLSIDPDSRTKLITISFEWRDPEAVARWTNRLVEMTNSAIRQDVIKESQRSIDYLEGELGKTNAVERRQIIYRLIESRTREIMMANGRPEYAFSVIDPAIKPDVNRYVWPNRPLIIVLGLIIGAFAGICACVILGFPRR